MNTPKNVQNIPEGDHMKAKEIKITARGQLKGRIWQSFMVVLLTLSLFLFMRLLEAVTRYSFKIPVALSLEPKNLILTAIWLILTLLVISPMTIGYKKYFLSIAVVGKGRALSLFDFFASFKKYSKTIITKALVFIRLFVITVILIAPAIFTLYLGLQSWDNLALGILFQLLGTFLIMIAVVFIIKAFLSMFLVPYLLVIEGQKNPFKLIKQSALLMKGNRLRVLYLLLSFISWFLLCLFIIPLFYVLPYQSTAFATLAESIIMASGTEEKEEPNIFATIEF